MRLLIWIHTCSVRDRRSSSFTSQGAHNMKRTPRNNEPLPQISEAEGVQGSGEISSPSRRSFIGKLGAGAAATVAASVVGSAPAALAQSSPNSASDPRVRRAYNLRVSAANRDKALGAAPHTTSGDEQLYADK